MDKQLMGAMMPSGLFDFQEDAIDYCCRRLHSQQDTVLALGTGMGKTVVCREILARLGEGKRALVFCPSGLVTQLGAELRKQPLSGERRLPLPIATADTGKELRLAVAARAPFIVVNVALQWKPTELGAPWDLVVIDEAHAVAGGRLSRILASTAGVWSRRPVFLQMTASSAALSRFRLFTGSELEQKKIEERRLINKRTREKVQKLCPINIFSTSEERLRHSRLLADTYLDEEQRVQEDFQVAFYRFEKTEPRLRLTGAARVITELRRLPEVQGYRERLTAGLERTEDRLGGSARGRELSQMMAALTRAVLGEELSAEQQKDAKRALDTPEVLLRLHHLHCVASGCCYSPPWAAPLPARAHHCVLASFPGTRELDQALREHPPGPQVRVVRFTTALASRQRAKIVTSLGAGSAALTAFRRAAQATGPLGRVLRIGHCWFLREVCSFVLPKVTVLAADTAVDLGYDLHKHVDAVWVPMVPEDNAGLGQIVGRLCRTQVSRVGKDDVVSVLIDVRGGTLDDLFVPLCRDDQVPESLLSAINRMS